MTVVTVLRGGGEYTPDHVISLFRQVRAHAGIGARFIVLTDTPVEQSGIEQRALRQKWPGWWAKMELYSAQHDDLGDFLYVDLDTLIVGSLTDVLSVNRLTLLKDFYYPERAQSGLMFLTKAARAEACAAFLEGPDAVMCAFRGDGEFLDHLWRFKAARWQDVLPDQVLSFKVHVRQRKGQTVPETARIVCYHGRPRPWLTRPWLIHTASL